MTRSWIIRSLIRPGVRIWIWAHLLAHTLFKVGRVVVVAVIVRHAEFTGQRERSQRESSTSRALLGPYSKVSFAFGNRVLMSIP